MQMTRMLSRNGSPSLFHHFSVSHTHTTYCVALTLTPCTFSCSVRQSKSTGGSVTDSEPVSILHPEAARAESLIRNAWADAKLVAD